MADPGSAHTEAEEVERLLTLARKLVGELTYCVMATVGENGDASARVIQPGRLKDDWTVAVITNMRCRKVREIERSGRMTWLYQHDQDHSYVSLTGPATVVEDRPLKCAIWTPAFDRWNPTGPEDPATVFARLKVERIELWSAIHNVMPEPQGYSAAVLTRCGDSWTLSAT